jgi:hypothetical protein
MAIKEAFETIKNMKGKNVKLDFEQKSWEQKAGFESVRPNPEQYDEDFKESGAGGETEGDKDYQEYAYKTPEGEEFDKFKCQSKRENSFPFNILNVFFKQNKASFQTIHDINDIKFRPDEVELPDPSSIIFSLLTYNYIYTCIYIYHQPS